MEEKTGKASDVLVSVDMLVYNHEKYLAQAIEGVLMQEGDFSIELLIHDDASTDRSPDIIRSYAEKYPQIIKPIFQRENQYSQGVSILGEFEIPRYSGKYVAYCEGDDYWIDPRKLQKQVAFLEAHPDFVAVGHNVKVVDGDGNDYTGSTPKRWTRMPDYEFTLKETDKHQMFGQTASRVFRNFWKDRPELVEWFNEAAHAHGDTKMSLIASCLGRIWVMSDVMSAYRLTTTGTSWTARSRGTNQAERKIQSLCEEIRLAEQLGKPLTLHSEFEKTLYMAVRKRLQDPSEDNKQILAFVWERYPFKRTAAWSITKQVLISLLKR